MRCLLKCGLYGLVWGIILILFQKIRIQPRLIVQADASPGFYLASYYSSVPVIDQVVDGKINNMDFITFINPPEPPPPTPTPTGPSSSGILQFKSGFESNTYIGNNTIKGVDYSSPSGINDWDSIFQYIDWVKYSGIYLQGGTVRITKDPTNSSNQVLDLYNTNSVGDLSRSQWVLNQVIGWTDDGQPNLFNQQFYRQRMYFPMATKNTGVSRWYMIWESHTWEKENTRHGIYIRKNSSNNNYHFRVVQQRPEGNDIWENTNRQNISVPFGQWFTMEIFFRYHQTNGQFYVAIVNPSGQRQIVADFKGKTKYDTKLRDQMVFKNYHHSDFLTTIKNQGGTGTHIYIDDFEIWSDYPPNYP